LKPPLFRFPEPVRRDLEAHREGLAAEVEKILRSQARPCVAIRSERVSDAPLHRNAIARLFGKPVASPVLGPTASKFGGTPYCEEEEDWEGYRFLGQIDLAEATAVLRAESRLRGLLRLDVNSAPVNESLRLRWFESPAPARAVAASVESLGSWETRLSFSLSWMIPEGAALDALWPLEVRHWSDYDEFFPSGYNEDGDAEFHCLLGHKSSGLDYAIGFPADLTSDASYESLLRLPYDNEAGFGWGSNCVYVLVRTADLARGDLSNIDATSANA
jgi:hypothetical protein